MHLDIRYPIHFGGQPTTTDRYKTVLCSYPIRTEVPRIEMEQVNTVLDLRSTGQSVVLAEYDGRLFRKVCDRESVANHKSLTDSFESTSQRNRPHRPFKLWDTDVRPLGAGLWNRIAHRVYIAGNGRQSEKIAWPNQPFNTGTALHWTRNEFTFERWSKKLGEIAQAEFDGSVAEALTEADRLLWIGNELWLETPPLAYAVGVDNEVGGISGRREGGPAPQIAVDLTFLPDWLDHDLDRQYFPLSAKHEAMSYAGEVSKRFNKGASGIFDGTFGIEGLLGSDNLLQFDHAAYSVSRTTMLLAADIAVSIANKPDNSRGLTTSHHVAIEEAISAVKSLRWNPTSWVGDLDAGEIVEAWQRVGRPQGWSQFPPNRTNFANLICERTLDLLDTVPIMIHTSKQRFTP
jgi:hypothetical protein